jgi:hypothetical protein
MKKIETTETYGKKTTCTYAKKLAVRNIGKNRNHRNIWENTTGIYEKNKDDRNI